MLTLLFQTLLHATQPQRPPSSPDLRRKLRSKRGRGRGLRCCVYLLLLSPTLAAQQDTTNTFRRLEIGFGAGVLQHGVDFTPAADDETFQGNNYGLMLRYFDNKFIGFQAELSYVEAGWREDFGEDFTTLYTRQTNYAELLILTQISVGQGAVQPLLQAGPYLSVPLSESEDIPAGYVDPGVDPPAYYGLDIPFRLNYGVQIGAGLNVSLGPVTIQADGRYLIGFNDLIGTGETTAVISRRIGFGGHVGVLYAIATGRR